MQNKHKQIVCEHDKIILNDGVTILPGYIELSKDGLSVYTSIDPHNSDPRPGVLKNRVKDENGNSLVVIEKAPEGMICPKVKDTFHFCKLFCYHEWLDKFYKEKNKKAVKKTKKKSKKK